MGGQKGMWIVGGLLVLSIAAFAGVELLKSRAASPAKPKALVTTFKGDPRTSRAFTWHTGNPEAAAVVQVVKGAENITFEEKMTMTIKGETTSIEVAKGRRQGVHKAIVTDLEPGAVYTYRVGSGEAGGWSEPAIFMTEPEALTDFTFLNVTDSQGVTENDFALWGKTLDKAFAVFPEAGFIAHNGDLTENPEDESAWDAFFGKAGRWLSRFPLMPVTGNHDEADKKADRFVSHFSLPDNGAKGSINGTSYSFDYGLAHFVVLNTESNGKEQTEWLRSDLAGSQKMWKIALLHRGPYGGNQDESVLQRWVPVFDEFGVDLALQGHNHEYSRSYPLKDGQIVREGEGTVYVVTNTSGPKFNKKKADQFYHRVHFQNGKQMFAGIRVNGNALTYQAYDVDGNMLDAFTLQK
ncbi:fibronectin type III domain-containing protein [Paenibacillus sp. MBLB4367]|uniref:fibronectin type III domain-containing protein n=1 Tax=Paenibacillus sp. MBLB4367 TaxID=3384767 RepID=UPI0039083895